MSLTPGSRPSSRPGERKHRPASGPTSVWLAYLALFGLSIPWYLPSGTAPTLWLGVPYWVVISLACCVLIASLNVFVINRHWTEDDEDEP